MEKKEISYEEYSHILSKSENMNQKQLEETVEYLKDKWSDDKYIEIQRDCSVGFLSKLLTFDWGRSIVFKYSESQKKFIRSEYLSNNFKQSIKELLDDKLTPKLEELLNSSKNINDMSEEEIKLIVESIDNYYYKNRNPKQNIASKFKSYIYKLNGKGIISYIKNNVPSEQLVRHILLTSGLNDRASYYSGRGVNYGDLNHKNLIEIYRKLLIIEPKYAMNFVELVKSMRTLGATEFIESFINLGNAKFNIKEDWIIYDKNVSLDGLTGRSAYIIGALSLMESSRRSEKYEILRTEDMKVSFLNAIERVQNKLENDENILPEEIDDLSNENNNYLMVRRY